MEGEGPLSVKTPSSCPTSMSASPGVVPAHVAARLPSGSASTSACRCTGTASSSAPLGPGSAAVAAASSAPLGPGSAGVTAVPATSDAPVSAACSGGTTTASSGATKIPNGSPWSANIPNGSGACPEAPALRSALRSLERDRSRARAFQPSMGGPPPLGYALALRHGTSKGVRLGLCPAAWDVAGAGPLPPPAAFPVAVSPPPWFSPAPVAARGAPKGRLHCLREGSRGCRQPARDMAGGDPPSLVHDCCQCHRQVGS